MKKNFIKKEGVRVIPGETNQIGKPSNHRFFFFFLNLRKSVRMSFYSIKYKYIQKNKAKENLAKNLAKKI